MGAFAWIRLVAVAALCLGLKAPAPTHADVGVVVHGLDQRSISEVVRLGIRQVRYTLYWSLWQDPKYRQDWETGIERALQAGLEPLVVVHQAPSGDWAHREEVYREFASFMAERLIQFPQVRAWQLWNEMDVAFTPIFGAGRSDITLRERGRLYAQMLRLAYPAMKRANPRALVVVGGIASDIEGGFIEGLYAARAQYDVLALHTYGFPLELAFRQRGIAARALMQLHHDNRPLWNTEFGIERRVIPGYSNLSAAQIDSIQLEAWHRSLEANTQSRLYDRVYGYVLAEGTDQGFGLVRLDGSLRPTYLWLKSWVRGQ